MQNKTGKRKKEFAKRELFSSYNYSSEIAPVGQAPAQEPQEIHLSASISYFPSPMLIAPTGH